MQQGNVVTLRRTVAAKRAARKCQGTQIAAHCGHEHLYAQRLPASRGTNLRQA